jgi:diguanylate cyclase (GGDEF)-like protein
MIAGKRRTIGVFMCKAYSMFDNAVFRRLEEEAGRFDYDIIIFTTVGYFASQNDYDSQELGMFAFAPVEELDGIIIAPDTYEVDGFRDQLLNEIRSRAKCPVVALRHVSHEFDCVYTDASEAFRPLLQHLINHHRLRRISFLAGYKGHPDSELRLNVFREEMAANGLPVDEKKHIFHGNMWLDCGPKAYEALFSDPDDRPEAVVCANDYMAVGLMRTLQAHGLHIPEDVIITGFDNVPSIATTVPTLTTVEQDFAGMASIAMERLDKLIREGKNGETGNYRKGISGKMSCGESCGCGHRGDDYYIRICDERNHMVDSMNVREVSMTYLTIETNACDDLKDLHQVLVDKMDDTPMVRDYYLCLFEKEKNENGEPVFAEELTEKACLVHAMRDRQDHGMPMITFDRCRLLPEMAERAEEPQVFYLMLLHQREQFYGYAMFHYVQGEIPSNFFQHWNVNLSGALSNMHKRNELLSLYEERRLSSITDVMTRLLNRRGLEEQLAPIWQRLCNNQASVAFVNFDLDRLKKINDQFGHQAGDFAIRLVANAIRKAAPKEAIMARMGGDEFLAVLPEAKQADADKFTEEFGRQIRELNREEDRAFTVEASCGAVVFKLDTLSTIERCIRMSDEEMYRIKERRHAEQGERERERTR